MKKQVKRVPIQVHIPIISDKQFDCPYEEPFGYIYKITNKFNGHYYIGQHEFHHPWLDKSYKGSGVALLSAYEAYGIENFDIIILDWIEKDGNKLNELEIYWIDMFGAYKYPFHYNLIPGGDINPMKIAEVAEKHRGENNGMYGRTGSDSPMHERMLSDNPMKNPEIAARMSKSRKGKGSENNCMKRPEMKARFTGSNSPVSKSVVQLSLNNELIKVYESTSWVKRDNFVSEEVSKCCRGKRETYKGYKWMYKKDYDNLHN